MIIFRLAGFEEVREYVRNMPGYLYQDVRTAFRLSTERIEKAVQARISGYPLQSRSGALRNSIVGVVSGSSLSDLSGRVYSNSPYAAVHEKGATIRAQNKYRWLPRGPYMNYPTEINYSSTGKAIMSSTQVFSAGGRVKYGPSGYGLYLGSAKMFNLAKSVKIPARLGLQAEGLKEIPTLLNTLQLIMLEDKDR